MAVHITFQSLTFTVQPKTGGPPVEILKGISGEVLPGRVLAIMGASGAGKTTLLDVLSGHMYTGTLGGHVLVNGSPRQRKSFQRLSSYVQQRDVLMASATVREAIMTAALLKLPRTMSRADKAARVDAIIRELDLEGCQNTLIGDELLNMKGISGGQRRRVSVGIELVKQPRVLFCDEPTSGLDSEMAVSMMETLVRLARAGRTVCVTIHQPNSIITSSFDDFMLLVGGRCAYFGVWSQATDLFASAGFPCPTFSNPTDHFLSVLRDPEAADAVVAVYAALPCPPGHPGVAGSGGASPKDVEAGLGGGREDAVAALPSATATSTAAVVEDAKLAAVELEVGSTAGRSEEDGAPLALDEEERPQAAVVTQVSVLSLRNARNWLRNPMMLVAEAVQYLFMAIFTGLVYLRLNHSVETGVPDRLASLWFSLVVLSFTPSYTAVVAWDSERILLRRETGQGMYSATTFFTAKTLTVMPVQIIQTTAFCLIAYFMVGWYATAARFFIFLAVMNLFQITSETIGLLCAIPTGRSTYAVIVLTFVLLFLMTFTGFLVASIPVYFKWIAKISYLTYAYTALVQNEFIGNTFYLEDGTPVPGEDLIPHQVDNGLSLVANIMVVLGLTVGTRLLAYLFLLAMAKTKRL